MISLSWRQPDLVKLRNEANCCNATINNFYEEGMTSIGLAFVLLARPPVLQEENLL
jgi:hypothetical protein